VRARCVSSAPRNAAKCLCFTRCACASFAGLPQVLSREVDRLTVELGKRAEVLAETGSGAAEGEGVSEPALTAASPPAESAQAGAGVGLGAESGDRGTAPSGDEGKDGSTYVSLLVWVKLYVTDLLDVFKLLPCCAFSTVPGVVLLRTTPAGPAPSVMASGPALPALADLARRLVGDVLPCLPLTAEDVLARCVSFVMSLLCACPDFSGIYTMGE